jgi:hypothetical protein
VFAVFTQGMALWKRGSAMGLIERDADFMTDRLAIEFRNAFPFPVISFQGASSELAFPTLVPSKDRGRSSLDVARVAYAFDAARGTLYRGESLYAELFADKNGLPEKTVRTAPALEHVASFKISYFAFNKKTMKLEWTGTWSSKDKFPMGVRLEIVLDAQKGNRRIVRTVYAPIPR